MTPTTFLRLKKATQAERDAAPCVGLLVGETALLRCGFVRAGGYDWDKYWPNGRHLTSSSMDIIATLDLQAALERLVELQGSAIEQ